MPEVTIKKAHALHDVVGGDDLVVDGGDHRLRQGHWRPLVTRPGKLVIRSVRRLDPFAAAVARDKRTHRLSRIALHGDDATPISF